MMRAPVLPHTRERLWAVVASRLHAIESGLELVLEGLDCSGGQSGCVDGLARDARGAPVLVILAFDGDALLLPRVVAASEFLDRVADALGVAIPEGNFCQGAAPRVLVIGTENAAGSLNALRRLDLSVLEVCRLEPFRIAGAERFAVRWLDRPSGDLPAHAGGARDESVDGGASAFEDGLTAEQREHWRTIERLCERLDAGVRLDGDRFRRRITWNGRALGQVLNQDGALRVTAADGSESVVLAKADVRQFGDALVRRYAELAGLRPTAAAVPAERRTAPSRGSVDRAALSPRTDSLRSAMAEALLSPEEFAALAEPSDHVPSDDCSG